MFGIDIIHFQEVPQFQSRTDNVEDPEIITWCKNNSRVWITHDFASKRKHEVAIKAARIHVVWVRGDTHPGATWLFFKMIVRTIDEIKEIIMRSRGAIHFRIHQKGGTRPVVDWAESSYDYPKSF